jgi:hypothetical protein
MAIKVGRTMLTGNYAWQAVGGDDPQAIRTDAMLFNRQEGYEVLPMIQKVVKHFGYEAESDVHRVEELIKTELPGDVRGREKVFKWLVERLS